MKNWQIFFNPRLVSARKELSRNLCCFLMFRFRFNQTTTTRISSPSYTNRYELTVSVSLVHDLLLIYSVHYAYCLRREPRRSSSRGDSYLTPAVTFASLIKF